MRNIIIFTVLAITTIVFSYSLMREGPVIVQAPILMPQIKEIPSQAPQDNVDKLASLLQNNQEQMQEVKVQQARLNKILENLETRLSTLETVESSVLSNSTENTIGEIESNVSKNVEKSQVSEADIGKWMDEGLRVENWDQDTTKQATYQAEESLEKVPGVYLENMQCSDRYCRASFTHEDGKQEAILDLFGSPPFENEGFTVNEPDGRVALYFARPGESLEEIRNEAKDVNLEYTD
jgi:hypothetical protein